MLSTPSRSSETKCSMPCYLATSAKLSPICPCLCYNVGPRLNIISGCGLISTTGSRIIPSFQQQTMPLLIKFRSCQVSLVLGHAMGSCSVQWPPPPHGFSHRANIKYAQSPYSPRQCHCRGSAPQGSTCHLFLLNFTVFI